MSNGFPLRRRNAIYYRTASSLYRTCIRIVSRNIEYYNNQCDLSQLPWNIKTDLIYLNMRIAKGFPNEESFIRLLTSNVRTLIFKSTIVSDSMLQCIAKRCKYLQELFLSTGNYNFTTDGLCKSLCLMKNLHVLQIVNTNELNETVIRIVCEHCTKLKSLWINDCPNVNDLCAYWIKSMALVELNVGNTHITDKFLKEIEHSVLSNTLRDICLKNCSITKYGLSLLNWTILENVNIMGASIDDLSFIPPNAVYKTLNWSV